MNQATKVMIVEDEAIIARDIEIQLASAGFAVTGTSANAADAFKQIERDSPDIVLMDISIQGNVDGIAAADVVRNQYQLPVIYLTAHADETTLERARSTEPFGFIVKPLGNTNMKAVITMALHKHHMERELDNHRKMLSTILHGLPDAVLVADPGGEVLFLNKAAEELTGWTQDSAAGRSLLEVAPMEDDNGRVISLDLVEEAVKEGAPVRVPRASALITRNRGAVEVAGQLAAARSGNLRAAGVFVTLQDVTAQRQEEQCLRQEHQMLVAGELARGVAQEFYALCNLIDDCASEIGKNGNVSEVEVIQQASQLGKGMAIQLMDLREGHGSSHALNVSQYLLASQSLLERFCRMGIVVDISSHPDSGYIVSTGNHFEQMLMNLCMSGRHFLNGNGKISIITNAHHEPVTSSRSRSFMRLAMRADKIAGIETTEEVNQFPFEGQFPDLNLSIVRAIAVASEGFSRTVEISDSSCLVEVFLPRYDSRDSAGAAAKEHSRVLLLVGLPLQSVEAVRAAAGDKAMILEAANLAEACLISELYLGDIGLIVVNDSDALPQRRTRAYERIRARRPDAGFLYTSGDGHNATPLSAEELAQQVESFFEDPPMRKIASA